MIQKQAKMLGSLQEIVRQYIGQSRPVEDSESSEAISYFGISCTDLKIFCWGKLFVQRPVSFFNNQLTLLL